MDDTFAIKVTAPELAYFGSLLKLPDLNVGGDWQTADEAALRKLFQVAQENLEAKNYIRLPSDEDEPLALDRTVATLVSILGHPQFGLTIQSFREKQLESKQVQIFRLGDMIVEQEQTSPDIYTLTACRTPDVAIERCLSHLGLKEQPAAQSEPFRIDAEDMAQIPYIIAGNGRDDGAIFLYEKGVPEKIAGRFASALENPVRQSLVQATVWTKNGPKEMGRTTILEDVYGLWLIAPTTEDGNILEVLPCTVVEVMERVRQLVFGILSGEPT